MASTTSQLDFGDSGFDADDDATAANDLREAWHGCGPGNTLAMIRAAIGPERVRAFLSPEQFLAGMGA